MNPTFRDCPDVGTWRAWLDREDVTAHRFARADHDLPAGEQQFSRNNTTRAVDRWPQSPDHLTGEAADGPLWQENATPRAANWALPPDDATPRPTRPTTPDQDGATTPLAEHLTDCPACQRLVAELREDADDVHHLLSVLAPSELPTAAEVAVARGRLHRRRARRERPSPPISLRPLEPIPMFFARLSTTWRVAASAIAAAVALALIIAFTPEGNSVAVAFLGQFRPQEVTGINVTPQTQAEIMKALNALGSLGRVEGAGASGQVRPDVAVRTAESQVKSDVTPAEAARTVGLQKLLTPDPAMLPAGLDKTPTIRVMPGQQLRFTFDKKKAQAYLQSNGHANVNLPDKFDGATLVVSIPPAALLEYGSHQQNKDGLIIGEAGQVEVYTQGNVSIDEMRDFLLGLPNLPPSVVSQLKGIKNWSNTLPIPVPVGQAQWQQTTINGSSGLVLWDNSGVGSAAIWNSNGHLFGVAGSLKATDLTNLANTLAAR